MPVLNHSADSEFNLFSGTRHEKKEKCSSALFHSHMQICVLVFQGSVSLTPVPNQKDHCRQDQRKAGCRKEARSLSARLRKDSTGGVFHRHDGNSSGFIHGHMGILPCSFSGFIRQEYPFILNDS